MIVPKGGPQCGIGRGGGKGDEEREGKHARREEEHTFEIPKSIITKSSTSDSGVRYKKLSGLMSLWMIPFEWIYASVSCVDED